jgi:DNA-binding LacI/PurR family transcriptional regulator
MTDSESTGILGSSAKRRRSSKSPRVTIVQVAEASGVSISTVSNVLNGRMGAMTNETRQRVEEAIRRLGYRPNNVARSLVSRRTSSIGVVIDEINTPLFIGALTAMERPARKARYSLIVSHASTAGDEREALETLLEKQVDAVALLSTSQYRDNDHLRVLSDSGIPSVVINRPGEFEWFSRVSWDNRGGVSSTVEYLHRLGHRRIAHLQGPANRWSTKERLLGYNEGLKACGLDRRDDYVQVADYTIAPQSWASATADLLETDPRPSAIIASDDGVAAVAIQVAAQRGLRVPDDLAVIGIDDQYFAAFLSPPLTTIRLPVAEAAEAALNVLIEQLRTQDREPKEILLPTSLVMRGSCGGATS